MDLFLVYEITIAKAFPKPIPFLIIVFCTVSSCANSVEVNNKVTKSRKCVFFIICDLC